VVCFLLLGKVWKAFCLVFIGEDFTMFALGSNGEGLVALLFGITFLGVFIDVFLIRNLLVLYGSAN